MAKDGAAAVVKGRNQVCTLGPERLVRRVILVQNVAFHVTLCTKTKQVTRFRVQNVSFQATYCTNITDIPAGLALRAYEAKCSATFVPSFGGGRLFRRAAKTPVLDWAVGLTESPRLQDTFRRILGHM